MDLFVIAIVAVIALIIAALTAVFNKKRLKTIFGYAGVGLLAGLAVGYLIAPFVISFF